MLRLKSDERENENSTRLRQVKNRNLHFENTFLKKEGSRMADCPLSTSNLQLELNSVEDEKRKILSIFKDESAKCDNWNRKYIASSMFVLGSGAYGSVFQVTTRQYKSKQKTSKGRYSYHPGFLEAIAAQRRVKVEMLDKLRDSNRDEAYLDIVAIKYEIIDQAQLEDGTTRYLLFLRREFLVLDSMWRKNYRQMHGFPTVFDYGYVGDKNHYGINQKYKNIFTYLNLQGEEVKFFTDIDNRNLEGVTKISYMAMELLGPSIDDFRNYYEPWFSEVGLKPFFGVNTVFKIADQTLCRLLIMHKCGFVHHDLKPDNIAMGNGRTMNTVYLLDFGFAKLVSPVKQNEWTGSRKYIAIDAYFGEKPNFAQDIESWFYVIMALLYDDLPWSDEYIVKQVDENADEKTRWDLVNKLKKSWWGEYSEATSLKELINNIAAIHSHELPDVKTVLEQFHKRVKDLRNSMRSVDDAQTLHCELSNTQSNIFRGYMSIRKSLLQIFNLPNLNQNPLLDDAELKALQEMRESKGHYVTFNWDRNNFEYEWDVNHQRFTMRHSDTAPPPTLIAELANQHSSWRPATKIGGFATVVNGIGQHSNWRQQQQAMSLVSYKRPTRADEVSYVYDPSRQLLLPKHTGRQRLNMSGESVVPFHRRVQGVFSAV
ncbi:hypothetical protein BOX15_Mlig007526g3 [Macrostomum lignano]|uniref:Protein kinase domain-containing protein n=1 Tax=Macrostomum lignano TaxID=282301 RepID=A0A267H5B2_9PLAT|nr:hypothetical protein BOX15_Mlig007526g3 [Macrostomum lignano]